MTTRATWMSDEDIELFADVTGLHLDRLRALVSMVERHVREEAFVATAEEFCVAHGGLRLNPEDQACVEDRHETNCGAHSGDECDCSQSACSFVVAGYLRPLDSGHAETTPEAQGNGRGEARP